MSVKLKYSELIRLPRSRFSAAQRGPQFYSIAIICLIDSVRWPTIAAFQYNPGCPGNSVMPGLIFMQRTRL
jgi:hypothetical protein